MNVIQQRVTELVDPRVEIELLADGFVFTEGPVWSFRDSHLPAESVCSISGSPSSCIRELAVRPPSR